MSEGVNVGDSDGLTLCVSDAMRVGEHEEESVGVVERLGVSDDVTVCVGDADGVEDGEDEAV